MKHAAPNFIHCGQQTIEIKINYSMWLGFLYNSKETVSLAVVSIAFVHILHEKSEWI